MLSGVRRRPRLPFAAAIYRLRRYIAPRRLPLQVIHKQKRLSNKTR